MNLIKLTLATLIFVMSFAMQSNEVKAQTIDCPTGWQYHEFTATDANGCTYTLKFCYQCNGFGAAPGGTIKYYIPTPVNPSDPNCAGDPDMGWVLDEIVDKYFDLCTIPPCGEETLQITADIPRCAQKIHLPSGTSFMQTCIESTYLCVTTFEVCYDASIDEYVVDPLSIMHTTTGILDCDITPPDFEEYPDDVYWESPCWLYWDCPPNFDD